MDVKHGIPARILSTSCVLVIDDSSAPFYVLRHGRCTRTTSRLLISSTCWKSPTSLTYTDPVFWNGLEKCAWWTIIVFLGKWWRAGCGIPAKTAVLSCHGARLLKMLCAILTSPPSLTNGAFCQSFAMVNGASSLSPGSTWLTPTTTMDSEWSTSDTTTLSLFFFLSLFSIAFTFFVIVLFTVRISPSRFLCLFFCQHAAWDKKSF